MFGTGRGKSGRGDNGGGDQDNWLTRKRRKADRSAAETTAACGPEISVTLGQQGESLAATTRPDDADCSGRGFTISVRWMIRRDMPEVLHIERHAFDHPWDDDDFTRALRQRNTIGMVAEIQGEDRVVGYMVYDLESDHIALQSLAVHHDFRRRGVGAELIGRLVKKLSPDKRRFIETRVRETNLAAQLFFKRQNFRAESVLFGHYAVDGGENPAGSEDAYVFRRKLGQAGGPPQNWSMRGHAAANGEAWAVGPAFGGRLSGLMGGSDLEGDANG